MELTNVTYAQRVQYEFRNEYDPLDVLPVGHIAAFMDSRCMLHLLFCKTARVSDDLVTVLFRDVLINSLTQEKSCRRIASSTPLRI